MAPKKKAPDAASTAQPDPKGRARLVAERAGVSLMTVSRALNGAPGVSEHTRNTIRKIADELGYQPNFSAQSLRRGTSDTIAMLLDSSLSVRGEFNSDTLSGVEQVVSSHGYNLLLMVPRSDEGVPGLIKRLIASTRCQATVLRFDRFTQPELELLAELDAPIAIASHPSEGFRSRKVRLSSASFDNRQGMARAVRHLVALGHRRIAYLGGTQGWLDAVERENGFRAEMKHHDLQVDEEWVRHCDFAVGYETGSQSLDSILSSKIPGPTAVACASDKIAAGAIACARRWGIHVPSALSVTGFDDDSWTSFAEAPLTTVRQDGFLLGQTLGRLVLEEIDNPDAPGRHVLLDTPLIVRQSTAPPRAETKERRR